MTTLLLRLEGPLQSWGTQGRFGIRDTEREPTKSGVLGLVGAALGMSRDDQATLSELRRMGFGVRVDREGGVLRDYHTVGGGTFRAARYGVWSQKTGRPGETALTSRHYLQDASFLAALESHDDSLISRISGGLKAPRWPLALGRRACPPSESILEAVVELAIEDALRSQPYPARLKGSGPKPDRLRLVLEAKDGTEGSPRQDEPESFALYERKHLVRYVRTVFIDTPEEDESCS